MVRGCLITKWGAVWLRNPNGTRSFISSPSNECELKAEELETLDTVPKAHDGIGLYMLSPEDSVAACQLHGCNGPKPTPTQAAGALQAPSNGWGMGVASGWMEQASLRFNQAATGMFGKLQLEVGQPLLLVFGGASVNDMLRNWAHHVKKLGLAYAIACMDEKLFNLADSFNLPGVMMVEKDSSGEKEVTTKWKYFRMDPAAFMTMGILKVRHRPTGGHAAFASSPPTFELQLPRSAMSCPGALFYSFSPGRL